VEEIMDKLLRNERVALLVKLLMDSPGKIFTLGNFADKLGSAKSSISEDLDIIENVFKRYELGSIESISGASGGVRFIPILGADRSTQVLNSLCMDLASKERILPGGYLYMLDIIFNPIRISEIGQIFAAKFYSNEIDYVITVETKGIPLAFITAKYLNVPLVIVRHYSEATDGASVNINYVSGSSKKLQTMVLSLKALKRNSKLLFIDDFLKGGGTAKGIIELAKEFECKVSGIGVLIETLEPEKKLIENCFSLLTLSNVDEENGIIEIRPS
jgi:purine operon repressor